MRSIALLTVTAVAVALAACTSDPQPTESVSPTAPDPRTTALRAPFAPLGVRQSPATPQAVAKIALGRRLFEEKRLSKGGDLACSSCHGLATFGVDNRRFSTGDRGQLGGRNAPSVFNAADQVAQFWDGRAETIEDQAKGPVLNPVEMAMPDGAAVEKVLSADPTYVADFHAAFPGEDRPVTFDNFARAVGAFERELTTPGRWDAFLQGDDAALSQAERDGLEVFVRTGCSDCHGGALLGGAAFKKLGVAVAWTNDEDEGRAKVTMSARDRQVFKVPSLRNVGETGPYLHDGSVSSLSEAVALMSRHQLGVELSQADQTAIVTFLGALRGELPAVIVEK